MVNRIKTEVTVLLEYNDDGSDKLPTLVIGKYTSVCSCKMFQYFPQNMMAVQTPA
jgi:hypothetical protein